jgi:MFS superfamily sulfate permease-like transporter
MSADDVTTFLVLIEGVVFGIMLSILYASVSMWREVKRLNREELAAAVGAVEEPNQPTQEKR